MNDPILLSLKLIGEQISVQWNEIWSGIKSWMSSFGTKIISIDFYLEIVSIATACMWFWVKHSNCHGPLFKCMHQVPLINRINDRTNGETAFVIYELETVFRFWRLWYRFQNIEETNRNWIVNTKPKWEQVQKQRVSDTIFRSIVPTLYTTVQTHYCVVYKCIAAISNDFFVGLCFEVLVRCTNTCNVSQRPPIFHFTFLAISKSSSFIVMGCTRCVDIVMSSDNQRIHTLLAQSSERRCGQCLCTEW